MSEVTAILKYDSATHEFSTENIFEIPAIWSVDPIVSLFYGTVSLLTMHMFKNGGNPGLLSLCPTVVPIDGGWLVKALAKRIASESDTIRVTVFAGGNDYKSVIAEECISRIFVVTDCPPEDAPAALPSFRGWKPGPSVWARPPQADDAFDGLTLVEMVRMKQDEITDDFINDEITDLEKELSMPSDADILPSSRDEMEHLVSSIIERWESFESFGADMTKYLSSTDGECEEGDIKVGDGETTSASVTGLDQDFRRQMTGHHGEELNAPASLRVVQLMANTINQMSDMLVKTNDAVGKLAGRTNAMEANAKADSARLAEFIRERENKEMGMDDYDERRFSGITEQIATLVNDTASCMRWAKRAVICGVGGMAMSLAVILFAAFN